MKSLAKQLGPKGIRVNAVAPGPIWTPLQASGSATMEKLERSGGQTPLGRPGQPAELASIYVQLAAADASYANGQVYTVLQAVRGSRKAARRIRCESLAAEAHRLPSGPAGWW